MCVCVCCLCVLYVFNTGRPVFKYILRASLLRGISGQWHAALQTRRQGLVLGNATTMDIASPTRSVKNNYCTQVYDDRCVGEKKKKILTQLSAGSKWRSDVDGRDDFTSLLHLPIASCPPAPTNQQQQQPPLPHSLPSPPPPHTHNAVAALGCVTTH